MSTHKQSGRVEQKYFPQTSATPQQFAQPLFIHLLLNLYSVWSIEMKTLNKTNNGSDINKSLQ